MDTIKDYYSGYEGDPDYFIFTCNESGSGKILHVWDGYIYALLRLIKPDGEGWNGLALHYHMGTGWFDTDKPWKIPDVTLAKLQLTQAKESIQISAEYILIKDNASNLCEEIISMLDEAKRFGNSVYIAYDPPAPDFAPDDYWPVHL